MCLLPYLHTATAIHLFCQTPSMQNLKLSCWQHQTKKSQVGLLNMQLYSTKDDDFEDAKGKHQNFMMKSVTSYVKPIDRGEPNLTFMPQEWQTNRQGGRVHQQGQGSSSTQGIFKQNWRRKGTKLQISKLQEQRAKSMNKRSKLK